MSVSMWSYRPEVCDGGGCPGDCDLCDKPKNMEDEDDDTMRLLIDALSFMSTRGQMRKAMENGAEIHLCLFAEDEDNEILLDFGKAPKRFIDEVFNYDD